MSLDSVLQMVFSSLVGLADHVAMTGEPAPRLPPDTVITFQDIAEIGRPVYGGVNTSFLIQVSIYAPSYKEALAIAEQVKGVMHQKNAVFTNGRKALVQEDQRQGRILEFEVSDYGNS